MWNDVYVDLRQPVFETDESSSKTQTHEFHVRIQRTVRFYLLIVLWLTPSLLCVSRSFALQDFVCPPDKREAERLYYQYVYKTRTCVGFPYSCSCDGLDSHREEERRRGPIINYMPVRADAQPTCMHCVWEAALTLMYLPVCVCADGVPERQALSERRVE